MPKLSPKTAPHSEKDSLLQEVRSVARQIWLASLGAYAKVGQEGVSYFKELVKTGEHVQKKGKKFFGLHSLHAANETLQESKENFEEKLDKLELSFDSRVASALNRLGIPSKHDVALLAHKLEKLSALLEQAAKASK